MREIRRKATHYDRRCDQASASKRDRGGGMGNRKRHDPSISDLTLEICYFTFVDLSQVSTFDAAEAFEKWPELGH